MEGEKLGVNEILEILDGLQVVAVAGFSIAADGKIGVDDLKHLVAMAQKFSVLQAAVKDADLALKQAGDIDELEAAQIIAKVFEVVKAVKEAK